MPPNLRARLAFLWISKLYRQMYAKTGIATDSMRRQKASRIARRLAIPCRKLFEAKPMPDLKMPHVRPKPSTLLPVLQVIIWIIRWREILLSNFDNCRQGGRYSHAGL